MGEGWLSTTHLPVTPDQDSTSIPVAETESISTHVSNPAQKFEPDETAAMGVCGGAALKECTSVYHLETESRGF